MEVKMKVTIDRFEGNYAVCETEDGKMINIEKIQIPLKANEGDVLIVESSYIEIDYTETEKRKKEIENLTKDLWV